MAITLKNRSDRIVNRLPRFYSAWDARSVLFRIISALSNSLDQQEAQLYNLMKAHWVDTARGFGLDLLGFLFSLTRRSSETDEVFRKRIKHAIADYRGGGTTAAIQAQIKDYLELPSEPSIKENPRIVQLVKKLNSAHNDSWFMANRSKNEAEEAAISITVGPGEAEVENPTITSDDAKMNVRYEGKLKPTDMLVIKDKKAVLVSKRNPRGVDVTDKINHGAPLEPMLLTRGGSNWKYEEATSQKAGRFDVSHFDTDEFAVNVPPVDIGVKWSADLLATFVLSVPLGAMQKKSVTKRNLEVIVNSIKAAGIRAIVTIDKEK